jgi:hypothetical protein
VRRTTLAAVAVAVALPVVGIALLGLGFDAEASALSPGAAGWLAARRYLEERGCRVRLLDGPLGETEPGEVVAVTFPWQFMEADTQSVLDAFEEHLRRRGTLLLGVAGQEWAAGQMDVLKALGLEWREVRGDPPLAPWRWKQFASAEWSLTPTGATRGILRTLAPRGVPRMPSSGRVLYEGEDGVPAVFVYPRQGGQIVVLPAALLSNSLLGQAGNPDLLEQLRVWLGDNWTFDELHHGLVARVAAGGRQAQGFLSLFLLHLALVYALAVVALARRFGPAWADPAVIGGSTASFLIGLGALHHRLGHHPAAARLLLERARSLDPRGGAPASATLVSDGSALVALGQSVARTQAAKGGER